MHQEAKHSKQKLTFRGFVKEIRVFLIFFIIVSVVILVITNLNLFVASFGNLFDHKIQAIQDIKSTDAYEDNAIKSILSDAQVQALLQKYQSGTQEADITSSSESLLRAKLKDYPFAFNTLPPVNKILIPSLWLDVPVVEATSKDANDFVSGNYDKELTQWVVKYPTTPDPGMSGNALIFWHTSQEFWKKNVYGTIFKWIPKLVNGDIIKVIRDGNLYEYKVVDKFVVLPKQVNTQYMSYQNAGGSYLTLMGCYPLGTDKKRIMVVAELVK